MERLFTPMLDWCFPPRSDEVLVRSCTTTNVELTPRIVDGVVVLLQYETPRVRALIHEAKFYNNRQAQTLLAHTLQQYISTIGGTCLIVPVPISRARKQKRGYNQITAICKRLPVLRRRLTTGILRKSKHTAPQTSLTRADRLTNVRDAFTVPAGATVRENQIYILVDDVLTTGATMDAARATLAPQLPKSSQLICVALAH